MKYKALVLALGLVILSALPASAQAVYTYGVAGGTAPPTISYKADATLAPTSAVFFGERLTFTCGNAGTSTGNCLPTSKYAVTAVDDATGSPATWVKINRNTSYAQPHPPLPASSNSTFSAQLNQPNTLVVQVVKNDGAARSATLVVTVNGSPVSTVKYAGGPPSPTIKVTQAGQ